MKLSSKLMYGLGVVLAFASVIMFFQINSYGADKNHTNGLFLVLGILFGLGAVVAIGYTASKSGSDKERW